MISAHDFIKTPTTNQRISNAKIKSLLDKKKKKIVKLFKLNIWADKLDQLAKQLQRMGTVWCSDYKIDVTSYSVSEPPVA